MINASRLLAGLMRYGCSPLTAGSGLVSFSFDGERGHGPGVNREAYAALAKAASSLHMAVPAFSRWSRLKSLLKCLEKWEVDDLQATQLRRWNAKSPSQT